MISEREFAEKYLARMTDQQRQAVQAVNGAVLLLAVPGSGKTTVLVTRLGYMVTCKGIDPRSILTMTYTVAATKEMKQRFASMFGQSMADMLEFRTINGVCAKIIDYYTRTFRRQAFRLMDNEGDVARLVSQVYQEVTGEFPAESAVKDVRTSITYVKYPGP